MATSSQLAVNKIFGLMFQTKSKFIINSSNNDSIHSEVYGEDSYIIEYEVPTHMTKFRPYKIRLKESPHLSRPPTDLPNNRMFSGLLLQSFIKFTSSLPLKDEFNVLHFSIHLFPVNTKRYVSYYSICLSLPYSANQFVGARRKFLATCVVGLRK
jgi:hypothetical protein